jgi:hypothetical protein
VHPCLICRHQKSITGALKEADISVRRRALDLLFAMATPANAPGALLAALGFCVAKLLCSMRMCCQTAQARMPNRSLKVMCGVLVGSHTKPHMMTRAPITGIAEELLTYLTIADFTMREELVLKTAVLAERCVQPCCQMHNAPHLYGKCSQHQSAVAKQSRQRCSKRRRPQAERRPGLRRFHPDMEWYIDTMITLIERGGEFVTRDVWHSTVQLVCGP